MSDIQPEVTLRQVTDALVPEEQQFKAPVWDSVAYALAAQLALQTGRDKDELFEEACDDWKLDCGDADAAFDDLAPSESD